MSLGLCPTKLPMTGEGRTDHPPVPADFQATATFLLVTSLYLIIDELVQ